MRLLSVVDNRARHVTGTVAAGTRNVPIDKLQIRSIASSGVDANPIRALIEQLRTHLWTEPENMDNPTAWLFHLTPLMISILQFGPAAQDLLLEYVNDSQVKDQIIFLLGGVGNGDAFEPIIEAMATPDEAHRSAYALRVNLTSNLALTNITVGDVIWHYGGVITIDRYSIDPKSCWSEWWTKHSDMFDISRVPNRGYVNYPATVSTRTPAPTGAEASFYRAKDRAHHRLPRSKSDSE